MIAQQIVIGGIVNFKCLSLFANVGIGETYFDQCGIEVVVANEKLEDRAEFYSKMHPETEMIAGDITKSDIFSEIISKSKAAGVDFILATPPCQGMSASHALRAKKDDPKIQEKNSLIKQAVRAIKDLQPDYALIENVRGMASKKTFILDDDDKPTNIMPYIERELAADYEMRYEVLDAANYGTPHHRQRLITLLSKKGCPVWDPPKKLTKKATVREAIGHLLPLESGEKSDIKWHSMEYWTHNKHHINWMRHTATGNTAYHNKIYYPKVRHDGFAKLLQDDERMNEFSSDKRKRYRKMKTKTVKLKEVTIETRQVSGFESTYRRIKWDEPAPTVGMTNGSINSQNNVHPGNDNGDGTFSDARVLTIKELCAIVGLPEDWVDHLEHTKRREGFLRKVLGECFPPMMAKALINNIPTVGKDKVNE